MGVDDEDLVAVGDDSAADDPHRARVGRTAVAVAVGVGVGAAGVALFEGGLVELFGADGVGGFGFAGDEEGGFGESVAGDEAARIEADGGEAFLEAFHGVAGDGFAAAEHLAQAAEVEGGEFFVGDVLGAQVEREVGADGDGDLVVGDGFEPAVGVLHEVDGGEHDQGPAAVQGEHDGAHQAHVVVGGQPGAADAVLLVAHVGVQDPAVAEQVLVGEDDALGVAGRSRAVLDQRRLHHP